MLKSIGKAEIEQVLRRAMADSERGLGARGLAIDEPVRIMNVCGGHERSVTLSGMRSALPQNVELIPGPGCPVCVCPEEDIYQAIQLALQDGVILVAFGDMLRVPGSETDLLAVKATRSKFAPVSRANPRLPAAEGESLKCW